MQQFSRGTDLLYTLSVPPCLPPLNVCAPSQCLCPPVCPLSMSVPPVCPLPMLNAQTYEFVPADRSLLVMPLFHVHGLMAGLLAPLAAGAGVILPAAGRFAASSFWADAVQYGMTFYTAVPTMHQILLLRAEQDYPAAAPPPLRAIRSCSSSLAPATLHKVEAAFKAPVLEVSAAGLGG